MTSSPSVVVHATPELLAQAAAARLVTGLVDVQAARGHAHVVLTGGGVGIATLAALAASPARDAVDWRALDVWWGDERFLPAGPPGPQRDPGPGGAARRACRSTRRGCTRCPRPTGAAGTTSTRPPAATPRSWQAAAGPEDRGGVPGVRHPHARASGRTRTSRRCSPSTPRSTRRSAPSSAVRGAPKPPPTRVSLTAPAIRQAQAVWLLAAGAEKAGAVSLALGGGGPFAVPAAGATGRRRTLWLLDRAAASGLPARVARIASP